MRIDHSNLEQLNAQARRERAQAIYELIIVPIMKFFAHAPRTHRTPARTHRRAAA
ncbi:MAG TPA: hypothetical protein VM183_10665 [Burkholderiales bacterium]|nr:hypothetical protein [Burkholderiales bacterium]